MLEVIFCLLLIINEVFLSKLRVEWILELDVLMIVVSVLFVRCILWFKYWIVLSIVVLIFLLLSVLILYKW